MEPWLHDGSIEVDEQPWLRRTSHGMGPDMPPPRSRFHDIKYYVFWVGYFCTPARSLNTPHWVITRILPGTERGTSVMIVGVWVTWAIYTQRQLQLWSSSVTTELSLGINSPGDWDSNYQYVCVCTGVFVCTAVLYPCMCACACVYVCVCSKARYAQTKGLGSDPPHSGTWCERLHPSSWAANIQLIHWTKTKKSRFETCAILGQSRSRAAARKLEILRPVNPKPVPSLMRVCVCVWFMNPTQPPNRKQLVTSAGYCQCDNSWVKVQPACWRFIKATKRYAD